MTNLTAIEYSAITTAAATSTVRSFGTRMRGFNVANIKDVVGAFEIKNGTTSRVRIVLPANGTLDTYLADEGIRCEDDVTVSVTPSVYATIYIG